MPAMRVVEAFNEVEDRIASFVVIPERRSVNQFALQRGEKALAHGVVIAVSDRTHRWPNAGLATSLAELNRRVLTTLIGVMNHCRRRSLGDGHLQRCGDKRRSQVRSHGPSDDLATPHIEHNREIEEPHPRRHVSDIGNPQGVRPIGGEVPIDQIGSGSSRPVPSRRHRRLPPTDSCQSGFFHQASDPLPPDARSLVLQLRVNARRSVGLARTVVNRSYPLLKLFVFSLPYGDHSPAPRVIAAGGDFQHTAHRADRKHGLVRAYEEEDLFDFFSVSCANQAAAFDRISRSSFSRAFSRRSRASSSRSSVRRPSVRVPSSSSACLTQFRIDCADGSNSRARSCALRPARTSRTICCRNSPEYPFRLPIVDSSPYPQVSTKPGQLQSGLPVKLDDLEIRDYKLVM